MSRRESIRSRLEVITHALNAKTARVGFLTPYESHIVIEYTADSYEVSVPEECAQHLITAKAKHPDLKYKYTEKSPRHLWHGANCAYVRLPQDKAFILLVRDLQEITLLPITVVLD